MSPLHPADFAYRPNSIAAFVLYSTIPAMFGTLPAASAVTASSTAFRSSMVSARGSPELPNGTKPSTPWARRNLTNARVPARLTSSFFSNAVMVGAYTPRGEKRSGTTGFKLASLDDRKPYADRPSNTIDQLLVEIVAIA